MKRIVHPLLAAVLVSLLALVPACAGAGEGAAPAARPERLRVRVGVMRGEGALPVWVAEQEGVLSEAGLDASVVQFDSSDERKTALIAGAVDCIVADAVSLCLLERGGFPSSAVTVMLGSESGQGRHGIVARPGSKARVLADLKGERIGVSLHTQQEYILDSLFARAGIPEADVVKEEVKKIPVRYELLMNGKLEAAAFPEPWLSLAVHNKARLIADDTDGENLSVSYLIGGDEWLASAEGSAAMPRLLDALSEAVETINADPSAWRRTLVERVGVPPEISDGYPVQTYPSPRLPDEDSLARVQEWMLRGKLIDSRIPYADLVWEPRS